MQGNPPDQAGTPSDLSAMDRDQLLQRLTRCLIHNMSNPLAAIVGCSQLIDRVLQRGDGVDAAQCRVYAGMILSEAEKCARALDRLALLAHPPEPRLVPVDIHEVLQSALAEYAVPAGVCLALERQAWEPVACADTELTLHVLRDLLQNAAEAMPDGGAITIRTENVSDGGEWVRLTVADEGPGIPADVLPKVTEPFFTTRPRHNGIGLTICAQLVGCQGGRLRIRSEQPGAQAILDLPRAQG